ncbi:MAG: 3-deoxy-8-phosphooctulonate synthase [Phycisphaerales bacterium]|nr:3-deoxy-8-phosphooctulonate synthase [Phycisphaerales bacterium]
MQRCSQGSISLGDVSIGHGPDGQLAPLTIIAGPCVLESDDLHEAICTMLAQTCGPLGLPWIFKGSFDKANRTSLHSPRGPGIQEGLAQLASIGERYSVPVTTDVHEPSQAATVAQAVDLLQVPAFLCRQSDLLQACGETGLPVNIKKGQFLSPGEMEHAANKALEAGAGALMLTERGTFFGYHRLVNDFIGLGDLMALGHPVCFDVTHSTQLPGAGSGKSGGRPERAALLSRAAVAAGVDALFIECHTDPSSARSDGATVQTLEGARAIIQEAAAIRGALAGTSA